jgi:hypothetical protein
MKYWEGIRERAFIPPGYLTLPEVFNILGRTIFHPEQWPTMQRWSGKEDGDPSVLTADEHARKLVVYELMHRHAAANILQFCAVFEGKPLLVEPVHWLCDKQAAYKRFEYAAIDWSRYLPKTSFELDWPNLKVPFHIDMCATSKSVAAVVDAISIDPDFQTGGDPHVETFLEAMQKKRRMATGRLVVDDRGDNPKVSASASKVQGKRVSEQRVEKWFHEVRVPQFEGETPPTWKECWQAAKEHFFPDFVVRDVLLSARRKAVPASWSKPGPSRSVH